MSTRTLSFGAPRGMRDFYPEDMLRRERTFEAWREASRRFAFHPYEPSIVEHLDLLKRKAGEEIVDQIYHFKDKSGRDLALRAEVTPSLARMIASRQGSLSVPLKWYSIAQCFRYERMSKGRRREHFQWNLDIVGEPSVSAEAEIVAAALCALDLLGLEAGAIVVHVNSRALLSELLGVLRIDPNAHGTVFLAVDKRGKIENAALHAMLREAGLSDAQTARIFELLDVENLDAAAGLLPASSPALQSLRDFFALAEAYGIRERIRFNLSVVRGLAYYTGIVFEAFDRDRKFRAVFGGGRYDHLLNDIGGRPETAVGLGFGDIVLGELLDALRPAAAPGRGEIAIGYMQPDQRETAVRLAARLRAAGHAVRLGLSPQKAKAFFSAANRENTRLAAYLGPDDIASGTVRLKNLETRQEHETSLTAPHVLPDTAT